VASSQIITDHHDCVSWAADVSSLRKANMIGISVWCQLDVLLFMVLMGLTSKQMSHQARM
jgi:hypothetical protein